MRTFFAKTSDAYVVQTRDAAQGTSQQAACMHVLNPLRGDPRVRRVAGTLASSGINVTVVDVEEGRGRPRKESMGDVTVKHIRLPERFSPYYHSNAAFVPWMLFKVLRMLLGMWVVLRTPADVYHAVDLVTLPACYVAARLRGKPLVFEAHELPLAEPSVTSRPLLRRVSTWLCSMMVAQCAGVITVSPLIVDAIQRQFGGPRAALVRNIPPYFVPDANDRIRSYLGLSPRTRIALFQGYLRADRSLDILVLAAQYLDEGTIIVLLGSGEIQGELQRLIERQGVGDRIKILPAVPYAELLDWTASADIGLDVSRPGYSANTDMSIPNKLFEYMMAGLPVLASDLPAMSEMLRRYDVGHTLFSLDPDAVARAIDDMLDDTEGLERMRQHALTACRNELCWEVEGQSLLLFYGDLLRAADPHQSSVAA